MEYFIEQLAVQCCSMTVSYGMVFNSEQGARRHLDRINTDLRHGSQQGNQMLTAGLHYVKKLGNSFTATFAGKILKNLKSSKKFSRLIDEEIIQNNQAMSLFLDDIKPLIFKKMEKLTRQKGCWIGCSITRRKCPTTILISSDGLQVDGNNVSRIFN